MSKTHVCAKCGTANLVTISKNTRTGLDFLSSMTPSWAVIAVGQWLAARRQFFLRRGEAKRDQFDLDHGRRGSARSAANGAKEQRDVSANDHARAYARTLVVVTALTGSLVIHAAVSTLVPATLVPPQDSLGQAMSCVQERDGQVRALLVGVTDYPASIGGALVGPKNDVVLMAQALKGVNATVKTLSGRVTETEFAVAAQMLGAAANCGDTVLVHYSGNALNSSAGRLVFSDFVMPAEKTEQELLGRDAYGVIGRFNDADYEAPSERRLVPGSVAWADVIVFSRWLRRRGVNVVVVVDSDTDPGLATRFVSATPEPSWVLTVLASTKETSRSLAIESMNLGSLTVLTPPSPAIEAELPPNGATKRTHGAWTYSLATAVLASEPTAPFRELAKTVSEQYYSLGTELARYATRHGVLLSTHPDRPLLAVGSPRFSQRNVAPRAPSDRRIELTNPPLTRATTPVVWAATEILIEGKVVAPTQPRHVQVNQLPANLAKDGSFSARIPLRLGENRVAVTAWFEDVDYVPAIFTVVGSDQNGIGQSGKRYALIIANQTYVEPTWRNLKTPIDDAQALAKILSDRIDFKTEYTRGDGTRQSLIMLNATQRGTLRALSDLRNVMQPADSLLVYFAGHGVQEKETNLAYWLPVDAELREPTTWVSSQDVNAAIQRLNAKHVLVVADSCFAGGFNNRGEITPSRNEDVTRDQYLARLVVRSSRQFISSGGNEPVLDGGGRGHSVFAQALIDAMSAEDRPFSANELFSRHLRPKVSGTATQVPELFQLKVGHDGGDMIFSPSVRLH